MTERDAIARMQRGDINGLAVLVARYQEKAVQTATLITRDAALAEDVVQSTFIRIYKRIHQFDSERPFEPWFMRSVVNAAIRAAQKRDRTLSLQAPIAESLTFEDLLADSADSPLQQLEAAEQRDRIRDALDALSPEQRAAVVMRYFLDMSEADMASETNTPKGTIKWRLYQARRRLRALLGGRSMQAHKEVING